MITNEKVMEIFYAEDQRAERMLFELAIEEIPLPTHLTTAVNGEDAMTFLKEQNDYNPDIIFLDLNMPLKDGHECLKEIRGIEKFKSTPIVILSSSLAEADVAKAYEDNASLFVQKPFDISHQTDVLKNIFSLDWKKFFPHPSLENFVFGSV
jgi:CheY-like chemotaxis protein